MKKNIYLIYVGKDKTGIYWNDVPLTSTRQNIFGGYFIDSYEAYSGVKLDSEWFYDLQYCEMKLYKIDIDDDNKRIVSVVPQNISVSYDTNNNTINDEHLLI